MIAPARSRDSFVKLTISLSNHIFQEMDKISIVTRQEDRTTTERDWLNDFEQLLMLAVARLADDAYGMRIRHLIEERAGRAVPIASIYAALERLERRGCLNTWMADPTPERGGRAKKHFEVTGIGADLLHKGRSTFERMWEGIELRPELGES